ncbi:MAG: tol-pal system protein YbgF [Pseudomonadota bacterium]
MLRKCFVPILMMGIGALTVLAPTQAQPAPIVQGTTSGDLRVANAQLNAQILDIQSENSRLTGRVETLEFLLSQSRDQINNMQTDDAELEKLITALERQTKDQAAMIDALTDRLNALEGVGGPETEAVGAATIGEPDGPTVLAPALSEGGAATLDAALAEQGLAQPAPQGTLGTLPASALPGDAGALFSEAKSRLLRFDYAGAEAAFTAFLDQFADDPQAGAAQYWLAETLYQQNEYSASGQAYTKMIRTYPDDPLAPEALAKMARSMRLIGDTRQACGALNLLDSQYPNASGVTKNLAASERVRAGCSG